MSGSWLNVAACISMPVESSRPVVGHLIITTMARSVTMGASRLKALHKSLHSLTHRAQRNLGTSGCAFDHSTQSRRPRAQPKRLRRLPPKAQQNIGATLGSPRICKRTPRGLGFTAMRSKMHSPTCRQASGKVSLTRLLRRPLQTGMNV
jgi:hypothetical protein